MAETSRTITPGQCAYAAFAAAMTARHASWGMPAFADLRPAPDYQDAWEAAAQAVLDARQAQRAWTAQKIVDTINARERASLEELKQQVEGAPVRKRGQAVCAKCSALLEPGAMYCSAHPQAEVYIMLEEENS